MLGCCTRQGIGKVPDPSSVTNDMINKYEMEEAQNYNSEEHYIVYLNVSM